MSTRCKACNAELYEIGKPDELCIKCLIIVNKYVPNEGDDNEEDRIDIPIV